MMDERGRGVRKAGWPSAHRRQCVHSTLSFTLPSAIVCQCMFFSAEVASPCFDRRLWSLLLHLFQRNTDHYCPHDIIELEVPFGAVRMGIMAADARLGHSKIRIDGLEVPGASYLHKTGIGLGRMSENSTQA